MNEPPSHHKALRVLSIREGARRMGICRSTYYDRIKRQPIPHLPDLPLPIKHGSRSGIVEHEVDAFILGLICAREGNTGNR